MVSTHTASGTVAERGFNLKLPTTTLGTASLWLASAFIAMFVVNMVFVGTSSAEFAAAQTWRQTVLPFYGIGMMLVGFSAGIVGLVAIVRQHERSMFTLLTVLPTAFVTMFLVGEFVFPH